MRTDVSCRLYGRYGASRRAREPRLTDSAMYIREGIYSRRGRLQVPYKVFTHISMKRFINDSFLSSRAPFPPPPTLSLSSPAQGRGRELISNFARPVSPRIKTHCPTLTVMLARKCSFLELHSQRPGGACSITIFMAVRATQFSADLAMHAARRKRATARVASHLSAFEGNRPIETNDRLSDSRD